MKVQVKKPYHNFIPMNSRACTISLKNNMSFHPNHSNQWKVNKFDKTDAHPLQMLKIMEIITL